MSQALEQWTAAMRGRRYDAAWDIADASLGERDPAMRDDPSQPYHLRWVWDGTDVSGRDVLVRCYHGLGDTIQFARFLPLLAERARSVTVEVQSRLIDLLATVPGIDRIVAFDPARPLPASECTVEITELDHVLRASPADLAAPYMSASRAVLPAGTIGLCHAAGDWDPSRSVPATALAPVCDLAPCLTLVAEATDLPVLNPAGCPFDMGATASLVAGASLVITVDTMIAHLAGAFGRAVWLLLKAEPDWRWAPDQVTSDWYPTMRLYVQQRPGDWSGVVDRVVGDLAEWRPTAEA